MNIKLDNVDWDLLREQKEWLVEEATETIGHAENPFAKGLLSLLDDIQYQAAEQLGTQIVFGELFDDEGFLTPMRWLDRDMIPPDSDWRD